MTIRNLAPTLARMMLFAGVGVAIGCSSPQPWEEPVDPALDVSTILDAKEVKSAPAAVMVLLPVRNLAGDQWQAAAEAYASSLRSQIIGGVNVTLRAEGPELSAVVDQLNRSGTALYDPNGAVQLGKLANAQYVGYVTVLSAATTSSPVKTTEYRGNRMVVNGQVIEPQAVEVIKHNAAARIDAEFKVVEVSTGKVVHSKGQAGQRSLNFVEQAPAPSALVTLVTDAARDLGAALATGLGNVFPTEGYLSELRGGQKWALINVGGANLAPGVTLRVMHKRTTTDPVHGLRTVEDPIGSLQVHSVSPSGVWCRISSGKPKLQLGMKVTTGGGPSR